MLSGDDRVEVLVQPLSSFAVAHPAIALVQLLAEREVRAGPDACLLLNRHIRKIFGYVGHLLRIFQCPIKSRERGDAVPASRQKIIELLHHYCEVLAGDLGCAVVRITGAGFPVAPHTVFAVDPCAVCDIPSSSRASISRLFQR